MKKRLLISFSGGETSGYMTRMILSDFRRDYSDVMVVFANTGQENEETLEFVDRCDRKFGFNVVWVEAKVVDGKGNGTRHSVVDFASASRDGRPFEEVIRKYGIPNAKAPHCTRELKLAPIRSYAEAAGWGRPGDFDVAVGIRADEAHRRAGGRDGRGVVYPLLDWRPTTKPMVEAFWKAQDFRLMLPGYRGNCKWCWKKSYRKLLAIMEEDPKAFDFPHTMEVVYGKVGAENVPGLNRTFFRGNRSVRDLRAMLAGVDLTDQALKIGSEQADEEPKDEAGCTESCEVTWQEDK